MQNKWDFDSKELDFDKHVKNSVPFYDETHRLISFISTFFLKENSLAYEIGCSTGTLLERINQYNDLKSIKYIGIEPAKRLVSQARKKIKSKNVQIMNAKVENFKFKKSDLIIAHFVFQFIEKEEHLKIFSSIYKSLKPGGAFIFFEKCFFDNSETDFMLGSVYNYDFKKYNKFSAEDIYKKKFSLRGLMKLNTEKETKKILAQINFKETAVVFKWGQFTGYLCIK